MRITDKFAEEFSLYKNYEERMGNKLKFVYNTEEKTVTVFSEEWDAYDGYDSNRSPYYFLIGNIWEGISIMEFAQLMEFYLNYKQSFDRDGIFCYFEILVVQ